MFARFQDTIVEVDRVKKTGSEPTPATIATLVRQAHEGLGLLLKRFGADWQKINFDIIPPHCLISELAPLVDY